MTHGDRLRGMLSTAEGQQAVIDWLSSEMTQVMLGMARDYARPSPGPGAQPHDHSYELGRACGAFTIVDLMSNPLSFRVSEGDGLVPDYGLGDEGEVIHGDN